MQLLLVMAAIAAQSVPNPRFSDNQIPDAALISKIESEIEMPQGAGPLSSYDRAYTQLKVDGRAMVVGQLIDHRFMQRVSADRNEPPPPPLRRVLEKDLVPAFDGGCLVVGVFYDIEAETKPRAICNPPGPQ